MNYLCIDIGGSCMKYALISEQMEILEKSTYPLSEISTSEELLQAIADRYEEFQRPEGGIAISYCGELDHQTGYLYNGGSYPFMAGHNLKEELKELVDTKVSVENDGNCAAIAEYTLGSLKGCENAMTLVIGTGLAATPILNGRIYRGSHNYAGFLSFMIRNCDEQFSIGNMAVIKTSANYLGRTYSEENELEEKINGIEFFQKLENGDEKAEKILKDYCHNLANVIFNVQLLLDVEKISIGGGVSVQPRLQEELKNAYQKIYQINPLNHIQPPQAEIVFCKYNNDANLLGALIHLKESK